MKFTRLAAQGKTGRRENGKTRKRDKDLFPSRFLAFSFSRFPVFPSVFVLLALAIAVVFLFPTQLSRKEQAEPPDAPPYFIPSQRLPGVGYARRNMPPDVLEHRTQRMIEAQTFAIMREPEAMAGAARIMGEELQEVFRQSAAESAFPKSTLEAIAYLESWGDPKAKSPTGPRGIMQMTEATARRIGLTVARGVKHVYRKKVVGREEGKPIYKTYKRRVSYIAKDDRLTPAKAIPAAAKYLASLEQKFGQQDLAIAAYHCGEAGVWELISSARTAEGFEDGIITVPKLFFLCSPAFNQELYSGIKKHMARDYSPTYWFRIKRAEQLLALYREQPQEFEQLFQAHKNPLFPKVRSPHRLWLWFAKHPTYRTDKALNDDLDIGLVRVPDNPDFFGLQVRHTLEIGVRGQGLGIRDGAPTSLLSPNPQSLTPASPTQPVYFDYAAPSTVGALTYIVFEVHRLYEAMGSDEPFAPLHVTQLVRALESQKWFTRPLPGFLVEYPLYCTGKVGDISYTHFSQRQAECLNFILDELGWYGYLGFVRDAIIPDKMRFGPSPTSETFFGEVYRETGLWDKRAASSPPQTRGS